MPCPSCSNENREGATFCEGCGASLARVCSKCQAQLRPSARFCDSCGQGVDEPSVQPAPSPGRSRAFPASFAGGRYVIKGFLGEGGRKRVYLAHDTRLDRDVAFAVIKTEGLDADGLVRVRREAQAMGRLGDHQNIVTIHDVGEEDGQQYIVSQYMAGGSVEDLIAKAEARRLSVDRAMRVSEQVCLALEHAHSRGVVHRDIKPGNVWLTADGEAQLGDFGLAIALDRSRMTMQGMMVGTVAYMSPEQALGRHPEARSDLYSLGAMMYDMVTGRPPFLGDDAVGVISQHINTAPVAPTWHNSEIPRPLETVILRLLAKSPEERPANAAEVAKELRRILNRTTDESIVRPQEEVITDLRGLDWGRFVGRRQELEQLKASLESALSGKLALAVLAGEPGIGKTRLAEEFAVYAGLRGAQVLTGRCYEGESSVPYRPFVEALRQYVRSRPDAELRQQMTAGLAQVATLVSEVRERVTDISEPVKLEGEAERLRLFDGISDFLSTASTSQPLLIFLDDLHWADKPSLLLLQHIARHAASDRLLVLATYRDVDLDRSHPLSESLTELRRLPHFHRIALRGLPADDVKELLSSMDLAEEGAAVRHVLAEALYLETEGNPFFIREVLAHLVETGKLVRESGRWVGRVQTVSDLGIPQGVKEVIGRRLSRLSDGCNRILTRASAMSRGFTWEALVAICDESEADLLAYLEEALAAQVVAERKGETQAVFEFTHALIRQTLYEELSGPRRVLMHRQIGEALEKLYAKNIEPHLAELAHHFYEAAPGGDITKGIDYSMRAGNRAMQLFAWEEAAQHYERALNADDMEQPGAPARRCQILLTLGEALWTTGDYARARTTAAAAAELARSQADPVSFARAALNFAGKLPGFGQLEGNPMVTAILEEALPALGEQESQLKAMIMGRLAQELAMDNQHERRWALSHGAIELARKSGGDGVLAFVLNCVGLALWSPENITKRLENAAELGELGIALRNRTISWDGHIWTYMCLLEARGIDRNVLAGIRQLADELHQPYHRWMTHTALVGEAFLDGRLSEVPALLQQALQIGQEAENRNAPLFYGLQTAWLQFIQGRFNEMEPLLQSSRQAYPFTDLYLRCVLARLYVYTGREEEARAEMDYLAADEFGSVPHNVAWLFAIAIAGDAAAALGDHERSRTLYRLLEPHADLNVMVAHLLPVCPVAYFLGRLAATLERWDPAIGHFEQALQHADDNQAITWTATIKVGYAEMLLQRDGAGDRAKALELASDALLIAQQTGMNFMLEQALSIKLKAQGIEGSHLLTSIDRVMFAVQSEHPAIASHAAPDGTVTIMFSDIEGSTEIADRLGDKRFMDVIHQHNAIIRQEVKAHGGFEVKAEGDGFMIAFQSARRALDCAIAIQKQFAQRNATGVEPFHMRAGLHCGEVIKEGEDFFGRNVILAARVANQAKGGEILVSGVLKALVESAGDLIWSEPRSVELKGLSGIYEIWPVAWGP